MTLRTWAGRGEIPFVWVGRSQPERRFEESDLDAFLGRSAPTRVRVEVAYVRVSGTSGQETSLAAQEDERRGVSGVGICRVYRDRASGMRERRPGLDRLLEQAAARTVGLDPVDPERGSGSGGSGRPGFVGGGR